MDIDFYLLLPYSKLVMTLIGTVTHKVKSNHRCQIIHLNGLIERLEQ
jgi:hypothetical protein